MTRHSTDTGLTERDVDLLKTLEKWGWFVTKVGAGDSESAFAYSMGLYENFHHPEIVLFGLDLEVMHRLINNAGSRIRASVVRAKAAMRGHFKTGHMEWPGT